MTKKNQLEDIEKYLPKKRGLTLERFLVIAFIALLVIAVLALFMIKQEGTKCIADPKSYYIKQVEKSGYYTNCQCSEPLPQLPGVDYNDQG